MCGTDGSRSLVIPHITGYKSMTSNTSASDAQKLFAKVSNELDTFFKITEELGLSEKELLSQRAKNRKPKNLICNFRAPNLEEYQKHQRFSEVVQEDGLDVCRVLLGFEDSWLAARHGTNEIVKLQGMDKVINIQQNNVFQYQVTHPHREPYSLDCVKPEFRRTFSSLLFEAYVLNKARQIKGGFSFRDFLELKYESFRRIIVRLRRKRLIMANPERTIPRFYFLAEQIEEYAK